MHKRRQLLYRNGLAENIDLFNHKIPQSSYFDIQVQPKKPLAPFNNSGWKNIMAPKSHDLKQTPGTSTHQGYLNYRKNFSYKKSERDHDKQNDCRQKQPSRKRDPSLEKKSQVLSHKSKPLSIREEDNTPTFSLIQDPSQQKQQNSVPFKPFNSLELPKPQHAASKNDYYSKKFKHVRHNSDQLYKAEVDHPKHERSYSNHNLQKNIEVAYKNQSTNFSSENNKENKIFGDLQARLENEMKKNEDLRLRCRQLLNTNSKLKGCSKPDQRVEVADSKINVSDELQKWRNIINARDSIDSYKLETKEKSRSQLFQN